MSTIDPFHEAVAVWRQTQQGTPEDLAELDHLISGYAHTDTALARIISRTDDQDCPLHIAADIDQIITEQENMTATIAYVTAGAEYATVEDARAAAPGSDITRRVTVETPVWNG